MTFRRRFAGAALVLAMFVGGGTIATVAIMSDPEPAEASSPSPWWYRCYHGNVGPSGGDFWVFRYEAAGGYHRYDHYVRGWDGRFRFVHSDYVKCH